jgi:hypothetical protein
VDLKKKRKFLSVFRIRTRFTGFGTGSIDKKICKKIKYFIFSNMGGKMPDPDPNFNTDRDPDPDMHQYDAVPHANPAPSFTNV